MTVLVTGASKGLGKVIAKTLDESGYTAVRHYHTTKIEGNNTLFGDFSTPDGVEDFIRRYLNRYKKTFALINNVGNWKESPLINTSSEKWHSIFQSNLHTPFRLIQALAPTIEGHIINIGVSGLDSQKGLKLSGAYFAAKQGLLSITRSFAKELAPLQVNMVSPGYLENSKILRKDKIPLGTPTSLEEVGKLITAILKTETLTGQNIEIDGGYSL